jgi:hypothetical protein
LGYRRARLGGLAGGATFGFKFGNFPDLVAASIFPSAAFSGSRRGARGNLSVSMVRRTAAVTAVSSSSARVIVGKRADSGIEDLYVFCARIRPLLVCLSARGSSIHPNRVKCCRV